MKSRRENLTTLLTLFVLPWAIYGWVALTGTTCSMSRYGRREEPRMASAEDLSTAFMVALYMSFAVAVAALLFWLKERRLRR